MGRPARYPDQFRRDALALVESSGRPIAEVARSLGVAEGTLWNWVKQSRDANTRRMILTGCPSPSVTSCAVSARRTWSSARTRRS